MDGVPLTEFYIEAFIREGLQDLRNDPTKIDMLFARFLTPILRAQYGQRAIDLLKEYIMNDSVSVVQAWTLAPEKVPCYSINIIDTAEDPARAFFDDDAGWSRFDTTPTTVATFVTDSYDSVAGYVHVADSVDLSTLYVGLNYVDPAGSRFPILGPILNTVGDKKFGIGANLTASVGASTVEDNVSFYVVPHHETPLLETVQIGIHAADNTNLCKYLYYLLLYFFQSKRLAMEKIGLQIHTFTVSDFVRIAELLPDNVLNRFVNLRTLTWFGWNTEIFSGIPGSAGVNVKVDKDEWIKGGDYTVLTTDENDE